MPEQRTANVQWSRTVEVVKASQLHLYVACVCRFIKLSLKHTGLVDKCSFLLPMKFQLGSCVRFASLWRCPRQNTVVCSCGNFLERTVNSGQTTRTVLSRQLTSEKAFRFTQACTRGSPQHRQTQNTLRHCKPAITCFE